MKTNENIEFVHVCDDENKKINFKDENILDVEKDGSDTVIRIDPKIYEKIDCIVPEKIYRVMITLNKEFKDVEYSIFGNIEWSERSKSFVVSPNYYIPKQEVSSTHIDYLEDNMNYNLVIHKHPDGCKNFSSTDEKYINQNFFASLLWVNGDFNGGIINIPFKDLHNMGNIRIRCKLNVVKQEKREIVIPQNKLDNITRKTFGGNFKNSFDNNIGNVYGGYGYGYNNPSINRYRSRRKLKKNAINDLYGGGIHSLTDEEFNRFEDLEWNRNIDYSDLMMGEDCQTLIDYINDCENNTDSENDIIDRFLSVDDKEPDIEDENLKETVDSLLKNERKSNIICDGKFWNKEDKF